MTAHLAHSLRKLRGHRPRLQRKRAGAMARLKFSVQPSQKKTGPPFLAALFLNYNLLCCLEAQPQLTLQQAGVALVVNLAEQSGTRD